MALANRVMLVVVGLVLFAAGGVTLAVSLGAFGAARPRHAVLSASTLTSWQASDWWWPGLVGGLSAVFVAALGGLLGQLGRTRRRTVRVDGAGVDGDRKDGAGSDGLGGRGASVVRSRAVAEVLVDALEEITGVDRADVCLAGRRDTPGVRIALTLTEPAQPAELAGAAISGPIDDLRRSLGRVDLPVEIVLRPRSRQAVADAPRVE